MAGGRLRAFNFMLTQSRLAASAKSASGQWTGRFVHSQALQKWQSVCHCFLECVVRKRFQVAQIVDCIDIEPWGKKAISNSKRSKPILGLFQNFAVAQAHVLKNLRRRAIATHQIVSPVATRSQHHPLFRCLEKSVSLVDKPQWNGRQIAADERDILMAHLKKPLEHGCHSTAEVITLLRKQMKASRRQLLHQRARVIRRKSEIEIGYDQSLHVV